MDQAQVRAMQIATESPGDYGAAYTGIRMAYEVASARETDDHYVITLLLRPQGVPSAKPGEEQFFIEKDGPVAHRQVLRQPSRGGIPLIPTAIGVVVVGVIVAVVAVFALGGSDGGPDPVGFAAATQEPIATVAPLPTATLVPTPVVRVTPISIPTAAPTLTRSC